MPKKPVLILVVLAFTSVFVVSILGQTSRKSVAAAEVTGTFRHSFSGKFGGTSEAIRILSIGKGKLKVAFDLVYPYYNGREVMANTGQADGTAEIKGDTAVYFSNEFGPCRIAIKFVKPGSIKVIQNGLDTDCGFGHNVAADGVYKKISSAKPKFRFD